MHVLQAIRCLKLEISLCEKRDLFSNLLHDLSADNNYGSLMISINYYNGLIKISKQIQFA